MSGKYVCIHGHFYQPPRENPWLEAIERQESAFPYHDWNERINAECYAPNAASRVLDEEGRIVRIVNNYSKISFNFGATLFDWMKPRAPVTYEAILEADRRSQKRFGGHGSAIAQGYGHIILPLANSRDKRTQVRWGIRDFEERFRRRPEGMWLAETAVDLEGLEIMADEGLSFTILAPHQARAIRLVGATAWEDVKGARIDPTRPYRVPLPSGRSITVFFYDGPVSRAVAFEQLLENGERFADRLLNTVPEGKREAPLVHIATDGETYGHHHRHGEMALSYALQKIEEREDVELINYGAYLERHPPTWEAQILEDTSWSCVHGVERWRSDCGCNSGGARQWSQAWRGPLRDALDWLRDAIMPPFEDAADAFFDDPWEARDGYIEVLLDRSEESIDEFFGKWGSGATDDADRIRGLKLMELQRHAMMMYTSCGWFFDELSGIETVQVIQYAGRVVQLAEELFDIHFEEAFLDRLEEARSNLPEMKDGRRIYHIAVEPARVDLAKVGAHYAVSSIFEGYEEEASPIYCYRVEREEDERLESGRTTLALGRARITSNITRESGTFSFGVLHLGDHNVVGGVRPFRGMDSYEELGRQLRGSFTRADYPAAIRILDRSFRAATYSLRSLFRDEQRRILERILQTSISEAERAYSAMYEDHAPLMRFVTDLGVPQPRAFQMAAEFVLNARIEKLLNEEFPDLREIRDAVEEARLVDVTLDPLHLGHAAREALERLMFRFSKDPDDTSCLLLVLEGVELIGSFPFEVSLWGVQNTFYRMLQDVWPGRREQAAAGDAGAAGWVEHFCALGRKIRVALR